MNNQEIRCSNSTVLILSASAGVFLVDYSVSVRLLILLFPLFFLFQWGIAFLISQTDSKNTSGLRFLVFFLYLLFTLAQISNLAKTVSDSLMPVYLLPLAFFCGLSLCKVDIKELNAVSSQLLLLAGICVFIFLVSVRNTFSIANLCRSGVDSSAETLAIFPWCNLPPIPEYFAICRSPEASVGKKNRLLQKCGLLVSVHLGIQILFTLFLSLIFGASLAGKSNALYVAARQGSFGVFVRPDFLQTFLWGILLAFRTSFCLEECRMLGACVSKSPVIPLITMAAPLGYLLLMFFQVEYTVQEKSLQALVAFISAWILLKGVFKCVHSSKKSR